MAVEPAGVPEPADEQFYARYLEACRAAGVEPSSRERVREPVAEWNAAFVSAADSEPPSPLH